MILNECYDNCEIFITGGSGVVGKALIEKLLRCCDVKRIYLLLRPKKDLNADQRLEKLRNAKIFRRLRNTNPDCFNKLTAVPGDAALPKLGITEDYAKLLENVSVIFHCAATIRFDESIKGAIKLNVSGTLEVLRFAETLKKLKIFMHVSTYFSNPYLDYVEPKLYESPMDWKLCMKLVESGYDEELLDTLTKKMITGFPNTYTFTKNLAESLVNEYRDRLPVVIYRPSIVLFAINDPEPGFPPSLTGAMGLFALVGAGILKTVYIHEKTRLDITPQDYGINVMLFYGTKAVEVYKKGVPSEVPIYMFSSSQSTCYTLKYLGESAETENMWEDLAFEKSFLIPSCVYTSNRLYYKFLVFTKEVLPALLGDFILILTGRKPTLMSIVRKAYITLEVMQPFMFNNIDSPGITLRDEYTKEFGNTEFDIEHEEAKAKTEVGFKRSAYKMIYKIREILLKEDPKTLKRARRILKIKIFIYDAIRAILVFYTLYWIYQKLLNSKIYQTGY